MAITYDEFIHRACEAGCGTISIWYRPRHDEAAAAFTSSLRQLLTESTYSVRSANASRTSFTNYDDADAVALRFDDLLNSPALVEALLAERVAFANFRLTEAHVISLHCSACDRRIIVDGVHRLARLGADEHLDAPVHVVELSGRDWPLETPDFNLVCVCRRE